jgi:hypothetical protein
VTLETKAIRVAPGKSRTVDMLVYSDKPYSSSVPVGVLGYNEFYGGSEPSGFTYEIDKSTATPGDMVKVTITAPKEPAYDVAVTLAYTGPRSAHFWPVLVTNDKEPARAGSSDSRGNAEPRVPTITPDHLPKRPKDAGFNHRARRGYGHRMDSFAAVRTALVAERARASLPSSLTSEIEPRR